MHQHLLPAADGITGHTAALVDDRYARARSSTARWLAVVGGLGAILLATFVGLQLFLFRSYHRMFNPAVAVATVAAIVLIAVSVSTLVSSRENLRSVKKDAFDSILALERARAISHDANADESRYLLDPARAGQYERAFAIKSAQLADLGIGDGVEGYDAALARTLGTIHDGGKVTFGGYYGSALRNITFPGERAAADLTLHRYQAYELADRTIRRLNTTGNLDEAIRFCTSFDPGSSNGLFDAYDQALTAFTDINTKASTSLVRTGENDLSSRIWISPLLLLGIVALIPVGVRPRLAEYRA
jgi:hypothetical protein